jgi:hydroxymethylbilane synthase
MALRLGTRRSKLALAQAGEIAAALRGSGNEVELVPIVTSGDRGIPAEASGAPAGVKGSFVHEIVLALLDGRIDLAVHSAKDLPATDPDGIVVAAVPERADPRDVLVSMDVGLDERREDVTIGTSSVRRRAQVLRLRPGVRVVELRGNVDTRLRKLQEGAADALILAAAGLQRLGIRPPNVSPFDVTDMVPAPGQGALAVQVRTEDRATLEMVKLVDHLPSRSAFEAERRVMDGLGGGCALPLGAYALHTHAGHIALRAVVIHPDGSELVEAHAEGPSPAAVADAVVGSLLASGASGILNQVTAT